MESKTRLNDKKIAIFLTFAIYSFSILFSHPVVLANAEFAAVDDTYVSSTHVQQNYGQAHEIRVRSRSDDVKNGYIKFGYSDFIENEAESATLYLYLQNAVNASVMTVSVCDDLDWDADAISWESKPISKTPIRFVNVQQSGWYEIDVTNCINRQMRDKAVTFVLELEADSDEELVFSSSDASVNKPYLKIVAGQSPAPGAGGVPFKKFQAEEAETNGLIRYSVDQPDIAYEASGRAYAEISEIGQYVEFESDMSADRITVRYTIPMHFTGKLSLYKNDVFCREVLLSSERIWLLKEAMPGQRFTFWDEVIISETVSENDVLRLQLDSEGYIGKYGIDFLELELAPDPAQKPDNSWLSVTDAPYYANGTDQLDDLAAIQKCIDDSAAGHKKVWIPEGVYICSDQISVPAGVEVRGAGIWHTVLYSSQPSTGQNRGFLLNGQNVLKDFKLTHPYNARGRNGGIRLASNCTVDSVWVEHSMGAAIFGYSIENTVVKNCRVRNTFADGIHLARNAKNCVIENNTVRNAGDDGLALISYDETGLKNNSCINNTVECAPWGRGIALTGGNYNTIAHNHIEDTFNREGILVTIEEYNGAVNPFCKNFLVQDNLLVRCGRKDSKNFASIWVCAHYDLPMWGTVKYNRIVAPIRNGITVSKYITNLTEISENTIEAPASYGEYIGVYQDALPSINNNTFLSDRTTEIYGKKPISTDLYLWLKADQGVFFDSSQKIISWSDQSENGIVLNQTRDSLKPTYVRDALNGYPVVKFSDSYLGAQSAYTGDYSIYMVLKMPDAAPSSAVVFSTAAPDSTALAPGQFVIQKSADKSLNFMYQYKADDTASQTHKVVDADEMWSGFGILNIIVSENMMRAFVNEIETYTCHDPKLESANTFHYLGLGAKNNTADFAECEIAEILVYKMAHSDEERTHVNQYLKNRYFDWCTFGEMQYGFTDKNDAITDSISSGGSVTATILVHASQTKPITMVSALYEKESGRLLATSVDTKILTSGADTILECGIDPIPKSASGYILKSYFWNSFRRMEALCAPIIYESNDSEKR